MSTKCSSEPSTAAFWFLCRHGQRNSPPAGGEISPAYKTPVRNPLRRVKSPAQKNNYPYEVMTPMNRYETQLRALRAAFPYTIPIFAGFWFLGLTYGIYMNVSGFSFFFPHRVDILWIVFRG